MRDWNVRVWMAGALTLLACGTPTMAGQIYVGGNANAVGIVNQHPLARNEALYDTAPVATGLYNRRIDVDPMNTPPRRYDADPLYFDNTNAMTRDRSLINGAWWCAPTAALSLVRYWDNDPRFPNLFRGADTDRSVILEMAAFMDADDVFNIGGGDAMEQHRGVRRGQILPGLHAYFESRYPGSFRRAEMNSGVTNGGIGDPGQILNFGQSYDAGVRRGIPSILVTSQHAVVGMGYDDAFGFDDARHYLVNDPWNARANISLGQVGMGRLPVSGHGVLGTLSDELYGDGADNYLESPESRFFLEGALWVEPLDTAAVPEPSTIVLLAAGGVCALGYLRRRR